MKNLLKFLYVIVLSFVFVLIISSCGDTESNVELTVIYDANGGLFVDSATIEVKVNEGDKIDIPISPILENYKFIGWSKTKDGFDYWDFSTDVVKDNIILYAKWEVKEAIILSVEGSHIDNNVIYMTVSKDVDIVSLANMVTTSNNSYWKLYYDKLGQTEIPTKIAASKTGELNNGDNEFYIVVTSSNGYQTNTYKLIIHRSYKIRIDFYDYSTVIHSEYAYSGYEYEIIYTPEITGYTFEYWSYNDEKVEKIVPMGNIDIMAITTANHYTIELDSNGGNKLDNIEVEYGRYYSVPIPTRAGYTFMGWENHSELVVNSDGESVERYFFDSNSKYIAKWVANMDTQYKVEHYLQNLDNNDYPTEPYETDYLTGITDTLTNGSVKNYNGFTLPSITQVTINGDGSTIIKLYYERNSYDLSLSINNTKSGSITDVSGNYKYGKEITITATTNSGYTFNGWYDGDDEVSKQSTYKFNMPAENIVYVAKWTANIDTQYKVEHYLQNLGNNSYPTEPYETDCLIGITDTLTNGSVKIYEGFTAPSITQVNINGDGSSIIKLYYTRNTYTVTLDNQAEGVVISGINSGTKFDFDTQIKLSAKNSTDLLVGWIVNGNIEYVGNEYIFNVPGNDVSITTITKSYFRIQNKIYFGTYPQTEIKATVQNGLSAINYDSTWISYKYYINSIQYDFMYYKDLDIDGNGTYDYRGVYFTQYRPYATTLSTSYWQEKNGYLTNRIYWFSYDPIEWDILNEVDGKVMIISKLILDLQEYYPSDSSESFIHNGGEGYANNYELSNIRIFLNDTFYNTAFSNIQKDLIEKITVDNSALTTAKSYNGYVCNNTEDKLFLLSYKEAKSNYLTNDVRQAKGTNYAKCQGLAVSPITSTLGYSNWWLRSPEEDRAYEALYVYYDGGIPVDLYLGSYPEVYYLHCGVRPACWITL